MRPLFLALLIGIVFGVGLTIAIDWIAASDQIEATRQEVGFPEPTEPTEAVLWSVDVDGESAP